MHSNLAYQLSEAISAFCRANTNRKSNLPIRSSEMGALIYITLNAEDTGVLAVDLSDYFGIRKSSVAAMISALNKGGYIRQTVSPQDKRSKPLFPTKKGTALVDQAIAEYHAASSKIIDAMGLEKCQVFMQMLETVTAIVLEEDVKQ